MNRVRIYHSITDGILAASPLFRFAAWLYPYKPEALQKYSHNPTQIMKNTVKNTFRKYHRLIATCFCLPLLFTALTGMSVAIADTWLHQEELVAFLIRVHTFDLFGLSAILPVLNGLGLIGLVVTGLSMTGLFTKRHQPKRIGER
jgi:hypothetical protein